MRRGLINMAIGLVVFVIGVAITALTYAAASKGGTYFILWGAIAFGASQFALGLVQLVANSFTASGRATWAAMLWPKERRGRMARVGLGVLLLVAIWFVLPEAWKTPSVDPIRVLRAPREVVAIAYSPNGRWIAAAMGYGGTRIWDLEKGTAGFLHLGGGDVEAITFSPDGRFIAAVSDSGTTVWSSTDWTAAPARSVGRMDPVRYAAAFSPNSDEIATGSLNQGFRVWDLATGQMKWSADPSGTVQAIAYSPDGRRLAVDAGYFGVVKVYDAATHTMLRAINDDDVPREITTLAFLPNDRVAVGSYQGPNIAILNYDTGQALRTLRGPRQSLFKSGNVWSIAASPDGTELASAHSDGSVRFWTGLSDRPARTIFGHAAEARAVAFSKDGRLVASGGDDSTVKIWSSKQ